MSAYLMRSWWRVWFAAFSMLACVAYAQAAETEVSDDFLEYLGSVEDEQENWTDIATADKPSAERQAQSSSSSTTSEASKRNERVSEPDTQRNSALPAAKAVK
jgi:hypothetical protein